MADLIQNMQEVYKKWESRGGSSRGRLKNSFNTFSGRKQYRENDASFPNFSRSLNQRNNRRNPFIKKVSFLYSFCF